MEPITLYGVPFSLWTGRARSYLIKSRIDYREEPHASAHFYKSVLPKAGGRRGIPTIEFPDGRVIRDGVAIVDHFEKLNGHVFSPCTPAQRMISLLLQVIGSEGLNRPCMHYRFNFGEEHGQFLPFHFSMIYEGQNREQMALERISEIKEFVLPAWGVVPETHELIENLHLEMLKRLNTHFSSYPYFLGGRPCIGDFGMICPLYGHLGRDPKPLALMHKHAVRVFRWVERMNRPEPDIGEFVDRSEDYLANDLIPESLVNVLKHFAVDFVPETRSACDCINTWLAENDDIPPGTQVPRGVGMATFEVRGVNVSAEAQPFRFYVLKRLQNEFDSLNDESKLSIRKLLIDCDMEEILDFKLSRNIGRANNLEVWL